MLCEAVGASRAKPSLLMKSGESLESQRESSTQEVPASKRQSQVLVVKLATESPAKVNLKFNMSRRERSRARRCLVGTSSGNGPNSTLWQGSNFNGPFTSDPIIPQTSRDRNEPHSVI